MDKPMTTLIQQPQNAVSSPSRVVYKVFTIHHALGGDYMHPYKATLRVAQQDYTCEVCGDTIKCGDEYYSVQQDSGSLSERLPTKAVHILEIDNYWTILEAQLNKFYGGRNG